jgi:hypothetical protein
LLLRALRIVLTVCVAVAAGLAVGQIGSDERQRRLMSVLFVWLLLWVAWTWHRRRFQAEPIRVGDTVLLDHPAQLVWDFVENPESDLVLYDEVVRAYRVEGTPRGIGEQQAAEYADGGRRVIEVVEYVSGSLAVTEAIEPKTDFVERTITRVEPHHTGGCSLSHEHVVVLPRGLRLSSRTEARARGELRSHVRDYLQRTREVLEATSAGSSA